ncbi:MAG: outer membrane biosynthesis protein TonB [Candidatus Omnitrophota bacterium]|jgi:outer membrane biosynthesis protein TonB
MGNRLFYIALTISLVLHITAIRKFSLKETQLQNKQSKVLEVVYKKTLKEKPGVSKKVEDVIKAIQRKEEPKVKNVKIFSKKREFIPSVGKNIRDISKLSGSFKLDKKRTPQAHSFDKEKKVSISLSNSEKISNPKYLNYYQIVGGLIKEKVYTELGDYSTNRGEVYVTFLITANGELQDLNIKKERTVASSFLQDLAIKSVGLAAPFPPFPKGLDYPEFTFNIKLYFQPTD